ncbi:MAG: SprB repeat-containing protein [Bacteroidetes bacterium]|nr:SprB repeat-containing protein [Bacteroidota bacterium]
MFHFIPPIHYVRSTTYHRHGSDRFPSYIADHAPLATGGFRSGGPLAITLTASNYHAYNLSCNGAQDGWIDLTITGGVAPFQIDWSNKATTEDISGLAAGYYHVTVAAANGERVEEEITLTQPLALTGEITKSQYPNGYNISCFECFNGTLQITASGGTTPYAYAWYDGPTTAYRSHLGPMEYKVVVTDANGCTKNQLTTLVQPERNDWTMTGNAGTSPATQYFGTSDDQDLVFKTNATERMRLLNDGTIKLPGIGEGILKAGPGGALSVQPFTESPTPNTVAPFWKTNGNYLNTAVPNTAFLGSLDATGLVIRTNNVQRMSVTATGDLCIGDGTASPTLIVKQDGHIGLGTTSALNAQMNLKRDQGDYIQFRRTADNGYWSLHNGNSEQDHLAFHYFPASGPALMNRLVLWNDGKVSIGDVSTATPGAYLLYVEKGILTERVKTAVKSSAEWSDHVFQPNYRLMPLDEVAAFIQEHGHLPSVPSADRMVEEGDDMLRTDALLLAKIEELTLYMLQLKDRVAALERENAALKHTPSSK